MRSGALVAAMAALLVQHAKEIVEAKSPRERWPWRTISGVKL